MNTGDLADICANSNNVKEAHMRVLRALCWDRNFEQVWWALRIVDKLFARPPIGGVT